ncbi:hypothetical protein PAXINDRAFT_86395, partial [Paxillus involutus ATCC 200175]
MPTPPSRQTCIENVLQGLQTNAVSLWDIIRFVHSSKEDTHQAAWESLEDNCGAMLSMLSKGLRTKDVALVQAFDAVTKVLRNEMVELTQEDSRLHFGASTASASQLDESFVRTLALKLRQDPGAGQHEGDLGEIGGEEGLDDEAEGESGEHPRKWQRTNTADGRNTVITLIQRLVVCACIMAQNTNSHCNVLQSIVGIFCHSTGTPARVIDVLSHAGLSISASSINNAVDSLSKESASAVKKSLQTLQTALAYDNFDIDFKTAQPTVEHQSTFISSTSATAIPLFGITDPADLECLAQI